jgi:hypothetical protein
MKIADLICVSHRNPSRSEAFISWSFVRYWIPSADIRSDIVFPVCYRSGSTLFVAHDGASASSNLQVIQNSILDFRLMRSFTQVRLPLEVSASLCDRLH